MGKNTSISLSDHNLDFVHQQVKSGRFGSSSEVIRDALRLMEERELKLATLKHELQKGLESGPARPFDWNAFMEKEFGPDDGP
jgi:antitoxin ParD1/3/4